MRADRHHRSRNHHIHCFDLESASAATAFGVPKSLVAGLTVAPHRCLAAEQELLAIFASRLLCKTAYGGDHRRLKRLHPLQARPRH